MKSVLKIIVLVLALGSVFSCQNDNSPNYQYFPNMYEPISYEAYGEYDIFPNSQQALLPVEGTISRGHSLYEFENTNEGYASALSDLNSPLASAELDAKRGKELYEIYCGICHGNKGAGQGKLVKREKILGVPSYADRAITEGSIYHVIYYGKNTMGSYANLLNEEERWQVTAYVETLRAELKK
ncbi:cytochrome c [Flavobacteriaceae bacterium]|jgi:mono/diheme cytochrome c family protein|nr:cytochrome c [Flavobacteriaceae bacterium]MDB4183144.1 cytochrome c [Flavobacteriaceae bacterium]MDB4206620.1 cytochrome c [Flavobacteriaceae bacterium]MDC0117956.1 cytochrome c [bacterium]MDG1394193.1 cytochrome c [Flavobacteriaceae bacterium]